MIFRWGWDWPALTAFYELSNYEATEVDRAVQTFAREHAQALPSAEYRFVVAGQAVRVRVDAKNRTVLVLYVFRLP